MKKLIIGLFLLGTLALVAKNHNIEFELKSGDNRVILIQNEEHLPKQVDITVRKNNNIIEHKSITIKDIIKGKKLTNKKDIKIVTHKKEDEDESNKIQLEKIKNDKNHPCNWQSDEIDKSLDFNGYLYVIAIDLKGNRKQLIPNTETPDSFIKARKEIKLLSINRLKSLIEPGLHYLLVIVTEKKLALSITTKGTNNFDALNREKDFVELLSGVYSGKYGKFWSKMILICK